MCPKPTPRGDTDGNGDETGKGEGGIKRRCGWSGCCPLM